MYFHPPTLDPGPLATLVGLATLLLLLAQPLLLRRLDAPARPAAWRRRRRLGACLSLTEVLAAAAFVATVDVVTSADLGLLVPRLQGYESDVPAPLAGDLVSWVGTVVVLVAVALFTAALVVERRRDGTREPRQFTEADNPLHWGDAEWRWALWSITLRGLATTVVLFVVVYPLVTVFVGPLPAVAAVALALGWQKWGSGFRPMATLAVYGALVALCHALLFSGSLFVPLAAWCLAAYCYVRYARLVIRQYQRFMGQAAPMEVTVLDADGNPVRRPGR